MAGTRRARGWQGIGGTSGAAPLWAALLHSPTRRRHAAVRRSVSPIRRCTARPALPTRRLQRRHHRQQRFHQTDGGRYAATPGYDPVRGLGRPTPRRWSGPCARTRSGCRAPARSARRSTRRSRSAVARQRHRRRRADLRRLGAASGAEARAGSGRIGGGRRGRAASGCGLRRTTVRARAPAWRSPGPWARSRRSPACRWRRPGAANRSWPSP